MKFKRNDLIFKSKNTECAAWLYMPENVIKPPVVIMAHGFGGERSFGLPAYAESFARAGMACFVFDYRTFGDSHGEPRNHISPSKQLEDWQAAIAFVRNIDSLDSQRLALWGTSFSGGHVIVTAARDPTIRAIVAQVPFVDGRSSRRPIGYRCRAIYHGLIDIVGAALFKRRHYVPIVGAPSNFAMLNTAGSLDGAKTLLPKDAVPGERRCPAAIALVAFFYRPIKFAPKVICPALVVYADHDNLISAKLVEQACERMQQAKKVCLPVKHFEIYEEKNLEKIVELETAFLKDKLENSTGPLPTKGNP